MTDPNAEMRDLDALPREAFIPPAMVRKYGATFPISRGTALDLGLIQPTPAEQQQREAWRVEYDQRKQAATVALPVFVAALAAVTDPVARAVLDLHRDEGGRCGGCEDYEGYGPGWPCETAVAVAEALDIPVPPDLDMARG